MEKRKSKLQPDNIIGESAVMQQVFETVEKIAKTTATVIIYGESGTGKEEIARAVHRSSSTADHPFIEINCAAIPENLLEAELFGYERGAFTDAKVQKKGLLEVANRGTLFLDEIGLMGPNLQVKLLNALETRCFRRVGGTREIKVTTRFIAATSEDLERAVEEGTFREELYYRLNVIPIRLPPLRERGEDIDLIAKHFLQFYSREHGRLVRRFSPEAQELLMAYHWPGNVRELKNVIERAVLLGDQETIQPEDLSIDIVAIRRAQVSRPSVEISPIGDIRVSFPPWGISLDEVERKLIEEALKSKEGNISEAANLLHISRDTLRYRIRKYGLTR